MRKYNFGDWAFILTASFIPVLIALVLIWKLASPVPLMLLSEGEMKARTMKLSYKGMFWKTYDGWIPVGIDSEGGLKRWKFTVANGDKSIRDCLLNNEKVVLEYEDYILIPFRLGNSHQVIGCVPQREVK